MLVTALILVGVTVLGVLAHVLGVAILRRSVRGPGNAVERSLLKNMGLPTRIILPLVALEVAANWVTIGPRGRSQLLHSVGIALVLAVAFAIVRTTYVLDDLVLGRYQLNVTDNLKARQVHTQIQVLRRVTVVVVSVVSLSVVLLSFPAVRAAGAGLLASAGLAGLVAGVAAKPTAVNVVAGLQIAISQPIRVDDVVVVEGHWGRVEQIALTFVVVRVWDQRRLVVPISYFVQNSFENWTRATADIVGWVFLDVDYAAPVEAIRSRLHEILCDSPDWDGKTWNLQVTQLNDTSMQLRALMSSSDSSRSWNLQCEVREKMIAFLQSEYPDALPRRRAVLVNAASGHPDEPAPPRTPRGPSPAHATTGPARVRPTH